MSVHFTILGSGSGGNCAYLETPATRLLIDAGLSGRQIRQRLASIARSPETLHGILITHEHSDHIAGLTGLAARLGLPVYCNRLTCEAIEAQLHIQISARIFDTGASFEVGDITVDTFAVPHDANDPVGFLLHTPSGNIGFVTDLGHATKLVVERVRAANVLLLEANHDVKMLQDDPRRPVEFEAAHPQPARPPLQRRRRRPDRTGRLPRPGPALPGPSQPRLQPPRIGPSCRQRAPAAGGRHPRPGRGHLPGHPVPHFFVVELESLERHQSHTSDWRSCLRSNCSSDVSEMTLKKLMPRPWQNSRRRWQKLRTVCW